MPDTYVRVKNHCVRPVISTTCSSILASGYDFYFVFSLIYSHLSGQISFMSVFTSFTT